MIKRSNFLIVFASVLLLAGSFFFSGCETSRVGPEVTVNVPPAPAQPLVLQGAVYNSKTGAVIPGATVQILKLDGTVVATVVSGADGSFSYDITNLTNTAYKVTATANGFGMVFQNVTVDPVRKAAPVVSLPLDPVVTVAIALTPAGGTAAGTTNTEAVSNTPVSISVPANAVTTNTTVNVSTVTVNNVPPPTNTASSSQVGVTNLTPAGVTFAKPVTLSYPLPYMMNSGDKVSVAELVNGAWTTSSLQATVDATGLVAKLDLTKTGQYALMDDTKITGTVATGSIRSDDEVTFSPLQKTTKVLATVTYDITETHDIVFQILEIVQANRRHANALNDPSFNWLNSQLHQRYGTNADAFAAIRAFNSAVTKSRTSRISLIWDGVSAANLAQQPAGTGYWVKRFTFDQVQELSSVDISRNGYFAVNFSGTTTYWKLIKTEAVWIGHNQGTVVIGAW